MTPSTHRSLLLRSTAAASRVVVFALVVSGVTAPALDGLRAQAPERAPVVLGLGSGARSLGLGGAFQPDAGDPNAAFVNPALAASAGGFALGWQRFDAEGTSVSLATAGDWYGGGVYGGVQVLDWTGAAPGQYPGGVDPLLAEGGPGASEVALSVGYGRSLFGVRAGVGAKYLMQRSGATNAATLALDLGLAQQLGPGWLHLAARNIGAPTTWGETEVDLPTEVTLGWGAYGQPVGPLDLGVAAEVSRRADGEWLAGGGLEFGYWPIRGRTFVGRIGVRTVPEGEAAPVSFGGSYWGDALVIDYGFQPVDGTDGIHRVTLGWR